MIQAVRAKRINQSVNVSPQRKESHPLSQELRQKIYNEILNNSQRGTYKSRRAHTSTKKKEGQTHQRAQSVQTWKQQKEEFKSQKNRHKKCSSSVSKFNTLEEHQAKKLAHCSMKDIIYQTQNLINPGKASYKKSSSQVSLVNRSISSQKSIPKFKPHDNLKLKNAKPEIKVRE